MPTVPSIKPLKAASTVNDTVKALTMSADNIY